MEPLDTKHELPKNPELPELPEPHHSRSFGWLFSLAIGATAMFVVTLVALMLTTSLMLACIVAPITLLFVTPVVHAVADRAR